MQKKSILAFVLVVVVSGTSLFFVFKSFEANSLADTGILSDIKAKNSINGTVQIVTFGEKIPNSGGLIPVTISQITSSGKPIDSIIDWNFLPLGQNADNRYITWDSLPESYVKSGIFDKNNNEIIDWSKLPQPFAITTELRIYSMTCDSENKIQVATGHPVTYPLKSGNDFAAVKTTGRGLLPNDVGEYSMEFVSFFETKFEFPKNTTVILNETKSCVLGTKVDDYSKGFYSKVIFKID